MASVESSTLVNPLKELATFGQSVWYDQLDRSLFGGSLASMIVDDGLRGMTSNPTIFDKAIGSSDLYADDLHRFAGDAKSIYESLVIPDIVRAADLFRPLYDSTNGADGFVSLEVDPRLAHDTEGTIAEAARLWKKLDRPNVMIKIPATTEGIPAVAKTLASGINVNITLIFSCKVYEEVINAYSPGVASVASFFVSRIDTAVDKLLPADSPLRGRIAIANAKRAYQLFKKYDVAQRPLWASTSTKNPAYRDVMYVEELIGEQTVNTMPPATFDAFRDHGKVASTIEKDLNRAEEDLAALARAGISLDDVTAQLTREGVASFTESFEHLLHTIETRRAALAA